MLLTVALTRVQYPDARYFKYNFGRRRHALRPIEREREREQTVSQLGQDTKIQEIEVLLRDKGTGRSKGPLNHHELAPAFTTFGAQWSQLD